MIGTLVTGVRRLAAHAAERFQTWWQRQAVAAVLLVVCAVIGLAAIGFAVAAGFLALGVAMPPWGAALLTAGILALLALVAGLIAGSYARRPLPGRSRPVRDEEEEPSSVELASSVGRSLGENLNRRGVRSTDVVVAALVAGVALGVAPALRERLGRGDEPRRERRRNR
ncbi:MAG TPA: phage holin family protein [Woeseiaceae bacterium]|nr:phage holin family protein [Woeseiaceae bacterium]